MACPFELSKDGIESQFATNHVGHFLFTLTLMPAIKNAQNPRIVNLSSSEHFRHPQNGIDFENINSEKAHNTFTRYGQSKLANMLFTYGIDKRYGDFVTANSVHPGGIF